MKARSFELILGGTIVALGVIILLLNLGFFAAATELVWAALFGIGGLVFLGAVAQNTERWWALIPAATLLSLGLVIGLAAFMPVLGAAWGGSIFLGGMGLAFWAIYLLDHARWWAIIPAGALTTLATVAWLGPRATGPLVSVTLFLGLALTFLLVSLTRPGTPRRWTLIPADALLILAILTVFGTPAAIPIFWPTLLILIGLWLLYRAFTQREQEHHEDRTASQSH